jgi:hypothetical protein
VKPASEHNRAEVRNLAVENEGQEWCILRTSGPKTLPLARALAEAGLAIWTPVEIVSSDLTGPPANAEACVRARLEICPNLKRLPHKQPVLGRKPFCKHKRLLTRALVQQY